MTADTERELKELLTVRGYKVTRSAGSHDIDLTAIRPARGDLPARAILIEEKSTVDPKVRYLHSAEDKAQWDSAIALTMQGHEIVFCVRYKSGPRENRWRVFTVPTEPTVPWPLRRDDGQTLDAYFGAPDPSRQLEAFAVKA